MNITVEEANNIPTPIILEEKETLSEERMDELFPRYNPDDYTDDKPYLRLCVGSWKAYNECNEHAYGTCWRGHYFIDFFELKDSDELKKVLNTLGWSELEQEELFVQDYESNVFKFDNCDYESPYRLIDFIEEHRDEIENEHDKLRAIMDCTGADYEEAIEQLDDYDFYPNTTAEQYEEELFDSSFNLEREGIGWLRNYIDFEAMARDDRYNGNLYEVNDGVLITY